jgi:hypothetical protein
MFGMIAEKNVRTYKSSLCYIRILYLATKLRICQVFS